MWLALEHIEEVDKLLDLPRFRDDLIAAAGFSDKARSNLSADELDEAVRQVFREIFSVAGANFRAEILYRYLLTRGDSLGGSMRNWVGAVAQQKLTQAILDVLPASGVSLKSDRRSGKIQRISWDERLLLFDVTPPIIGKNVDVILLKAPSEAVVERTLLGAVENYLACGELKGGIDPAGADEHWKTAGTALLMRIRERLKPHEAELFFVGAAITNDMADELIRLTQNGTLSYAANLTVPEQLAGFARWLTAL